MTLREQLRASRALERLRALLEAEPATASRNDMLFVVESVPAIQDLIEGAPHERRPQKRARYQECSTTHLTSFSSQDCPQSLAL